MNRKNAILLAFAVIALVCFFRLGSLPISETDEGFAGTRADSFFRHGGWVLSYDDVNDDQPQFRKPPLLYWLVAVLLKVVGHTSWAVRLPTAVAGFLSALLLYRLARGAVGEGAALFAALLTCTVPFFVLHIRTAMLELPVICALLAGLAGVLLLPGTWWRPVAVGLCGGAALMTKGGGGGMAVAVPVLFGLVHQRLSKRAWAEALVALGVAAVLPALWYLAIPPEYRARVLRELVIGESARGVRATGGAWTRLSIGGDVLAVILRWHLPAAACGMALALARCCRNRDLAEWLGVSLAVTVPLLWVYAAMVPPFPRYVLMAVPFLLSFSAYFALEAASGRAAGVLLVPFAVAAAAMSPADPWRWLPVAAAAAALAAVWAGWAAGGPQRVRVVGVLLLAAIAVASWKSAPAWSMHPPPRRQPRPEIVPLMRQAAALIPAQGKLIVEDGFKVHSMLFYGRRAILLHSSWLLSGLNPGEVCYGVFQGNPLRGIPGIRQEEVGRSGPWRLDRLTVEAGERPLSGVILVKEERRAAVANTLAALGVSFEPFARGFVLRGVPTDAEAEVPDVQQQRRVLLPSGTATAGAAGLGTVSANEAILLELPAPRRITGVDILPASRRDVLAGWIVQAEAGNGVWSEVKRIEGALDPYLTVSGSRVRKASRAAARVRFPPVIASRLKLVRTAADPLTVEQVRVFEPRPGI